MAERTLHIFDETIQVQQHGIQSTLSVIDEGNRVLTIYERGLKGDKGDQGPPGFSGAGEPFYVVQSGSRYATTASLAIFASFSSSLIPYTGSQYTDYDVGSISSPWRKFFVSESIVFSKTGTSLVELFPTENAINIGQTSISTSSIGFLSSPVITYRSNQQQEFKIMSGSLTGSMVNGNGVFIVGDFNYLPPAIPGGILKSGSKFFVGI